MQCPKAAIFDLDDTLAESFKAPSAEVLAALRQLLERIPLAIMTGAGLQRMQEQFLSALTFSPHVRALYIFPNSSGMCYHFESGVWKELYNLALSPEEREAVTRSIERLVRDTEALRSVTPVGRQLFDREAQVAFTLVGVDAPLEVKKNWDPDNAKRQLIVGELKRQFPELEILMGGTTTVDITRKGVNKAYGVRWFARHLGILPEDMLYVGDALFPGGNDEVVKATGIVTRAVAGPGETPALLEALVRACTA